MQKTDTVQQRLDRIYQRKDRVTLADLLTAAHHHADLRSYAFQWAVLKLAAKMDDRSQEYQDSKRDLQVIRHCGSVAVESCMSALAAGTALAWRRACSCITADARGATSLGVCA